MCPAGSPEHQPPDILSTLAVLKRWWIFEPLLQIRFEEKNYDFVVDTRATLSLIESFLSNSRLRRCAVQARGRIRYESRGSRYPNREISVVC